MNKTLPYIIPIILLIGSNLFMTYAWYGHLKDMKNKTLLVVIFASWSIALFEYCLQVPANRMGFKVFSLCQLKIIQEIITVVVFAFFAILYMGQRFSLNYLYSGICLVGAAFFIFRDIAAPIR